MNIINKVAICNKYIEFIDGCKHYKNKRYVIDKESEAYFHIFLKKGDYTLIDRQYRKI